MVKVVPIRRLGGIPYAYPTFLCHHYIDSNLYASYGYPFHDAWDGAQGLQNVIFLEQSKMLGFRTGISRSHQHSHGAVSGNWQSSFNIYAYNSMDILICYTMNEIQWEMRILSDTVVALLYLYQSPLPKRHAVNQE